MNPSWWRPAIWSLVILFIVGAGFKIWQERRLAVPKPIDISQSAPQPIHQTGSFECLELVEQAQSKGCVIGFKSSQGQIYELQNKSSVLPGNNFAGLKIEIDGTLSSPSGKYKSSRGVITVNSAKLIADKH